MESSNQDEMCNSLLDWFKVFYKENCFVRNQHYKVYLDDLTDGVALAIALKTLVPDYFTGKFHCVDVAYTTMMILTISIISHLCKQRIMVFEVEGRCRNQLATERYKYLYMNICNEIVC